MIIYKHLKTTIGQINQFGESSRLCALPKAGNRKSMIPGPVEMDSWWQQNTRQLSYVVMMRFNEIKVEQF